MSRQKKDSSKVTQIADRPLWIESLATAARAARSTAECKIRTTLTCDVRSTKPSLFVPPDMAELQPASLRYLHAFAHQHDLTLVEDRRRAEVRPVIEKRDKAAPMIANGLGLLLKQTGVPGIAKTLSEPHRLNADSPIITIPRLIRMAAHAARKSKRVVVLPNRMIVDVLDNNTQPIAGYACKLFSADHATVLSHFDSSNFRAIGYSAGNQYVVHVCLAGGPLYRPALWANFHTLTRTDFQFQLFPGKQLAFDFGLMYATFYLDMEESPQPWWIAKGLQKSEIANSLTDMPLQQKAS